MRASTRVAIAALLLSPFLIWIGRIPQWSAPAWGEWAPYVAEAIKQSLLSSTLAMALGFLLFLAAQGWTSWRARALTELALLLPNMMPPMFFALSLLAWVTLVGQFPYGLGAVVAAHVLLNSGLVAISLDRLFQSKIGGMAEVAWILGSSRRLFFRRVAWPYLKADIACVFLFIFSLSFTSFSLPLLLGGERRVTLEVAIYDMIRIEGQWDKALILAFIQSAFLFTLAFLLPRPFWPARAEKRSLDFLALKGWRLLVFAPSVILLAGWLFGLANAVRVVHPQDLPLVESWLMTMALGLSVALLHLILFLLTAYVMPHAPLTRFLNGYLAPSSVITGFSLLLLPGEGETIDFLKLTLALTLISYPLLYRWIVHSALAALEMQITMARTLGARWSMILFEIVWPQAAAQILRACGVAAIWAAGDFAVSGIVAGNLNTLPLLMANLLGNYRIETAEVLMIPLLFASLTLYGLFLGASRYVTR